MGVAVLELILEELEKLADVLSWAFDEGPKGAGWPSPTLKNIISKVNDELYRCLPTSD